MPRALSLLQEVEFQIARRYALWRIGALPEEFRTYNTTDRVLLTFDDFGSKATITSVLTILRQENVRAFFFLQGDWVASNPDLVKAIADAGHWIGNHTYSHQHLTRLSDDEVRAEITQGLKTPLLRPPYGDYNKRIRTIAAELGFKISFWTIDSDDWKGISAAEIKQRIFPRLHKGACVLMHLNTPHTLEALPDIISGIRKRGYELCTDGTEIVV